jgi:formylglycine-generating enzyme required for sulfatase activity/serine/threonine protein kinase
MTLPTNDLSDADASWIDSEADRFELAWRSGAKPRIEDFLAGVSGDRRVALFLELMSITQELTARNREHLDLDEYRRRFPELAEQIDAHFRDGTTSTVSYPRDDEAETTFGPDAPSAEIQPVTPGDDRYGPRFTLLEHHADGGIGRVHVALDRELSRRVALKELQGRFADDPNIQSRFLREVEVTGRLEHFGVVPVYSLGRDAHGRPFYAMRFIEGETLEQAIARFHKEEDEDGPDAGRSAAEKTRAFRELLRRFLDVCDVVGFAHSRGVLHRDLKPQNVLLGPFGETVVADWGMAKLLDEPADVDHHSPFAPGAYGVESAATSDSLTEIGAVLGTIRYMSPEQADGSSQTAGIASDVYGLGATLYHLLTGRPPIEKGDFHDCLDRARRGVFPPPRQVNPKISPTLEAICLKAMKLIPSERYASPRALADDLERWLADEPVSAKRDHWLVRTRRWIGRNRVPVAAAAAALAVALLGAGFLLYQAQLQAIERRAHAQGLITALRTSEIGDVASITRQLQPMLPLVLDELRSMARSSAPNAAIRRRNAALALLEIGESESDELVRRLLEDHARPQEVAVIARELRDHGQLDAHSPRLWDAVSANRRPGALNLGAAGALAWLDPADPRWQALGTPIVNELIARGPLQLGAWREVFQPVEHWLVPPLRTILADVRKPRERALAASFLLDFASQPSNPDRDDDLADLISDFDPTEFHAIAGALGDRTRAISRLMRQFEEISVVGEPSGRRRGRIAAALIALGEPERGWQVIRGTPHDDPDARAELVHNLAAFGVPARDLLARLASDTNATERRALVLALGSYPAPENRDAAIDRLRSLFDHDPDPGVHSAVDWLLRTRWGAALEIDQATRALRNQPLVASRRWLVTADGQTMAIIRAPSLTRFTMGSPETEDGRDSDERLHEARIDRSFAIAVREVTTAEFQRFRPSESRACPDCPVVGVDWYTAALYCNWLSAREELAPYYKIEGATLSIIDRAGLGYRLPTEPEWEFACRAGSKTARPWGDGDGLLSHHAWFLANSGGRAHPVGLLEPNDLGLFDILGNAFEWTEDHYSRYRSETEVEASRDTAATGRSEVGVILRGGSFSSPATLLRSAYRERSLPDDPLETYGFRYVRSLPSSGQTSSPR